MQFSSIWPIDRTLSGFTTLGKSGAGNKGNEDVQGYSAFPKPHLQIV